MRNLEKTVQKQESRAITTNQSKDAKNKDLLAKEEREKRSGIGEKKRRKDKKEISPL